ncbi:MAG TPA: mechanosensitive ion channel family protein [Candidatus Angelobacter sp.]|jgi:small conductance mechanosensitive channel|nr:mechanosensitive ion channel family protein [Candidatus Angelobacter sp.]
MEPEKWANLLREWHDDLIWWARHGVPRLIVIFLLAFFLIRILGTMTRKVIELSKKRSVPTLRLQQVRTLAGVIHSVGVSIIVFIALLQGLPIFGVHIEPLLASAGIAGLAVGFGAQAMVKDVINGFFILVENQFEIGDTIKVAGVQGNVEEITMRRTILRDADGTLHIVPNGSIHIVSNMTRDWSQVTLHVAADYAENSDKVIQVLRGVAQSFYEDPAFHEDVVATPEVPGIERVTGQEVDYLMLVKVRLRKQDVVARELRRRIKSAFEENSIKTGSPAQVYIGQLPLPKT